jgi:hypothetical protein
MVATAALPVDHPSLISIQWLPGSWIGYRQPELRSVQVDVLSSKIPLLTFRGLRVNDRSGGIPDPGFVGACGGRAPFIAVHSTIAVPSERTLAPRASKAMIWVVMRHLVGGIDRYGLRRPPISYASIYSGSPRSRAPSANLSAIDFANPPLKMLATRKPGFSSSPRRAIGVASSTRPANASATA